ncbi:hypothetical protein [Bradyrhizobium sp.]|uniref:hypothetical protein n=1 Tax=Bradyrhizobium sp. TaxID=376 RepID=UPI002636FBF8|nr:hypothetical protein [Bradyrhizobium sp.]
MFEIDGAITAIGQSIFDNEVVVYAYLEITDTAGTRTMIEKVAVCNDVGAVLGMGLSGRYYVDQIFRRSNSFRCQLWGVKTDRVAVIDRRNLRAQIGFLKILYGIVTIPILGLGFFLIVSGIRLLILSASYDRQRTFVGSRNGSVPPPLPARVVRI